VTVVIYVPNVGFVTHADEATIFFDSHDVSKADSTSALSILDPEEVPRTLSKPDPARFSRIVRTLRRELGMALLGVDVVLERDSNRYAIIDINAYPG
jgi:inositol-1,3,4-trisphosphate 5/6-kinase/inositol-tetrakisphosphate 1-kinase